jgi:hypothetical protein
MRRFGPYSTLIAIVVAIFLCYGCAAKEKSKALFQASISAATGQSGFNDIETTLSERDIRAVAEYVFRSDEQINRTENMQPPPAGGSKVTVWITNSSGSQIKITLTSNPDGSYTGPKGERYPTMPTRTKLKQSYGF